MPVEIQSALIQGIFGAITVIVGIFIGRSLERKDRARRKIIETGVSSTVVVNPRALGHISMSVDKNFLTGQSEDKGMPMLVTSAYNHVIGVSNTGTDDIEKPEIDILFDDKASVVEFNVSADTIPQDKIEIKQDLQRPNYRRIIPQYINSHTSLTISVLSINNETANCNVKVGGIGIIHRARSSIIEDPSSSSSGSSSGGFDGWTKFLIGVLFAGVLLGFAFAGNDLLNPSTAAAEANRINIETAHQQATNQLEEQLAAAKTEAEIQAIQRQQELLNAQYQHDLQALQQDLEHRDLAFKTWMSVLSFLGGAFAITMLITSTIWIGSKALTLSRQERNHKQK